MNKSKILSKQRRIYCFLVLPTSIAQHTVSKLIILPCSITAMVPKERFSTSFLVCNPPSSSLSLNRLSLFLTPAIEENRLVSFYISSCWKWISAYNGRYEFNGFLSRLVQYITVMVVYEALLA